MGLAITAVEVENRMVCSPAYYYNSNMLFHYNRYEFKLQKTPNCEY